MKDRLLETAVFVLISTIIAALAASPVQGAAALCGCPATCPVCEPLQAGVDATLSKSVLEYGESADVSILVRNSEPNITSISCAYGVDGQNGGAVNVANDGELHLIGQSGVSAPGAPVDHQVAVGVSAWVNCAANLSDATGAVWCGNGCSSFLLTYMYPTSQAATESRAGQLNSVNRLSMADAALERASSMIAKAESAGSTSSPYLNSSKEQLAIANDFLTSASFMYDQLNFNATMTNSESAIQYAKQAEYLAYLAYVTASPATSYSYVLRLIEETERTRGHAYEEIKQIADTLNAVTSISEGSGRGGGAMNNKALEDGMKNLEEADRLLDDALKKLKEGDYTGAVEKAVVAKSLVEKAKDALKSMFLSVKTGILTAMENAYDLLLIELDGVSIRTDAASRQNDIDLEEIRLGRTSIAYARFRLIRASALIQNVRNANDVAGLVKASSAAGLELRSAREHLQDAALHVSFSFLKRYTAVGIISIGAALLGLVIWWIEKRKEEKAAAMGFSLPAEKQNAAISTQAADTAALKEPAPPIARRRPARRKAKRAARK